ncbi:hypothetical protein DY000_02058463 [Brassica cretica]|uniref:Uncharacterized protein n=1 Tax=Brassica cretica TaxID=69181 RepID=A0ABQ7AMT3_BRACR|nr:hypothetical protein DY000_02058463 [Brassica cretica]
MEFYSRGSNGSTAGSVFSVLPVFPLIRSGIGSECFVGVGARCRFRPIHCSLRFGGSCPAVGVVVSFLPCSVRIERLGSLEYRTDRCFGGSTSLLTDRGAFDFFLECLQLVALRVPSQPGLVEGSEKLVWIEIGSGHRRIVCPRGVAIGGIHCIWIVPVASLAPVNLVGVTSVPESDPVGSMSLTLEGVVPAVWLGSIVALRKLRSVS